MLDNRSHHVGVGVLSNGLQGHLLEILRRVINRGLMKLPYRTLWARMLEHEEDDQRDAGQEDGRKGWRLRAGRFHRANLTSRLNVRLVKTSKPTYNREREAGSTT